MKPPLAYFFQGLLPWGLGHLLLFLAIWRLFGRRKRVLLAFWVLSIAVVLIAGGLTAVLAFLAVLLFGAVLAGIGGGLVRALFGEAD